MKSKIFAIALTALASGGCATFSPMKSLDSKLSQLASHICYQLPMGESNAEMGFKRTVVVKNLGRINITASKAYRDDDFIYLYDLDYDGFFIRYEGNPVILPYKTPTPSPKPSI